MDIVKLETPHTIAQIVKGTMAEFSHYKNGELFYTVDVEEFKYEFPISIIDEVDEDGVKELKLSSDIGDSSFERTYKAITLMRYLRKAIDSGKIRWDRIV